MIAEEVNTSWAKCSLNVRNGEMSQRFYQWVYFGRSLLEDGWKNQHQLVWPKRNSSFEEIANTPRLQSPCKAIVGRSDWLQMLWQLWKTDRLATVGRIPSYTAPKFPDEIICPLRHLCFFIQQTFIENILCAGDRTKLGPRLQDLIVGKTGMNWNKQKALTYVCDARGVERNVWPSLGSWRLRKAAVFVWVWNGELKTVK